MEAVTAKETVKEAATVVKEAATVVKEALKKAVKVNLMVKEVAWVQEVFVLLG